MFYRTFLLAGLLLGAGAVHAGRPVMALTCIGTDTGYKVNFQYRWGKYSKWRSANIRPGKWKLLMHRYDYPGENRSPRLQIRYDDNLGRGRNVVTVKLNSAAARYKNCERQGAKYAFFARGDDLNVRRRY